METKKMRPLEEIMKDLTAAANDIQEKRLEKERLDKAQSDAAVALDSAQRKAAEIRNEMEVFLNLLVPTSLQQGHSRQHHLRV